MADLSITAGNVKWVSGTRPQIVKAGATITRGQALYQAADGEYSPADADASSTGTATAIALTDGADGSDMLIATVGATINVGATTVAGTPYVASTTAGGIAPYADITTGDTPSLLFWGSGTANVTLVFATGTALA